MKDMVFPLDEVIHNGTVETPDNPDIIYLFFLFFLTTLILNLIFTMDVRDRSLKARKAFYLSLGSFAFLMVVLSPDIFVFNLTGVHYKDALENIPLYSLVYVLLMSGFSYVLMYLHEKDRFKYLNLLFIVTSNLLWILALIIIGRTWYWAPKEQGYYGSFYYAFIFYFLPMALVLLILKAVSIKLVESSENKK